MRKLGKIIISIFTVILTLSFLLLLFTGFSEIRDVNYDYFDYEEEDYLYALQREDYIELVRMTAHDKQLTTSSDDTITACQAVARYYETASLYKAYITTNDTKHAKIQMEHMKKYASLTGEFSNYVTKINRLFEIG